MEEKNQNTGEYTGEYGNSVEATEDSGSSVYSYSYRENRSEATSSGDYHADDNERRAESDPGTHTLEQREEQQDTERRQDVNGQQSSEPAQNSEWKSGMEQTQENRGQQPLQQDQESNQTQTDQNPFGGSDTSRGKNISSDPDRQKGGLTWKKIGSCAALAVVFGIVAAVCFQGVCYFSSHVLGINVAALDAEIGYTTDHVQYTNTGTVAAVGTMDVSGIVKNTMPSIVAITSTEEGENYYDLFGQYYQGRETTSCGSGFIVGKSDTELLIATNNHVITGAKTISVQFIDDEVYEAREKGSDSSADLAVVAVRLTDLKSSTLRAIKVAARGDSSEAKVGEMVVAIGNALGYGQSVTVGYISAKDREITGEAQDGSKINTIRVIQTDAAINPGNSGGALLNMKGEVIGINSAKIADSSVEGVGYAIPISEADPIIDELMNREVLTEDEKGYLGISGKTVSEEAVSYNMPEGVYVAEIAKGGAADKGGIHQGDVITAINDIRVTTIESLQEKTNSYKKGTKVTITVQRNHDGEYQEQKVEVILQGADSLNSLPESTAGGGSNGRSQEDGTPDDGNGNREGNDREDDYYNGWGNWFPFGFGN